jgi:hypothetical protein
MYFNVVFNRCLNCSQKIFFISFAFLIETKYIKAFLLAINSSNMVKLYFVFRKLK